MAEDKSGGYSGGYGAGMTNKSAKASDSSTKPQTSASVNDDAVRTSVATTPKTLGPRTA